MSGEHTLAEALAHGTGIERAFLCPVHGDSRPSASVNVLKGLWICYTCGAKGNLDGVTGEIDHLELLGSYIDQAQREMRPKPEYSEGWLNLFDAGEIHPYWRGRFTDAAIRHFRLGYDAATDAVTYPLRSAAGRVLGVVRRPLNEPEGPKYRYPYGVDVSELLFNFDFDRRRKVWLVEGALDAVAMWEAGYPDTFAIYGARISERQLNLLAKIEVTHLVCVFDMDAAGERAYTGVLEAAPHLQVDRVRWHPSWGKDIAELSVVDRANAVAGLDQFVKPREEWIQSSVCDSDSAPTPTLTLRLPGASAPSRTTSRPGTLRIGPRRM